MSTQTDAPAAFATAVATTKQQVAPVTTATIKKVLNDDFENDKKLDQYQIDRLMEQGYTKGTTKHVEGDGYALRGLLLITCVLC